MSGGTQSQTKSLTVEFDDNRLLPQLFGSHNIHLARIEQELDVSVNSRGNSVTIFGQYELAESAIIVLNGLYARLKDGHDIDLAEVDAALARVVNHARNLKHRRNI